MAGLLELGGIGGIGGAKPPAALLGQYFDPAEMRRQELKQGLLQAGISMLTNGKGSTGEVLGQALGGGLQGANNAGINYRQDAMGYQQLQQQMEAQQEKQKQKAAIASWVSNLPPDQQAMAEAYPEQYAQQFLQQQFATTAPKAPSMETLYDEKSGQPYKAQWDDATKSWKRVGGNKADENGITITNPDGTTTQIGGSGTKTTEADRRAQLLTKQVIAQEPQLMKDFDTLATVQNSVGGATGMAGRGVMSAEGQMAKDSLTNVLANWLYLTSGATMNQGEIDRQVGLMLPSPFDKPETVLAKKSRVQSIFATMKERAGVQSSPAQDGGWTILPNGVKIRKKSQ